MQQTGGIKAFFATPVGRGALAALSLATLVLSFLYLGPFLAIPTLLLFGLAVPIYLGWKRIRQLALVGLIVLLIAAPIASALDVQTILQPSPVANSATTLPYGDGGPVLANAYVSPFSAPAGTPFKFTVTVNPQYVPPNSSALLFLELFVSTCPGATGNSSPYCDGGYPYLSQNITFPFNFTTPTAETFSVQLNATNVWWWQMATAYHPAANASDAAAGNYSSNLTWIFLFVQNGYNSVQGPVSGDFTSTFALVILPITIDILLYPGSVFFFALLVYLFFKNREATRQRQSAGREMTSPPPGPPEPLSSGTSAPKGPSPERTCPNCQALVYPSEANCWKCGAKLSPAGTPPAAP